VAKPPATRHHHPPESGGRSKQVTLKALLHDRRVWIGLGLAGALALIKISGLSGYLSLDTLRDHREEITALVARHTLLSACAYVAIYVAAVTFSLPGAVLLTLTGGFLFGAGLGTGLTVVAATTGATLVFLLARTLFGENALDRFGAPAARLAAGIRRDAAVYLLVLRLVPVFPFFLVNLVPAFAGVRPGIFIITTAIGIIPGTAVFSLAGAGLGAVLDQGSAVSVSSILTREIVLGLVGLAVLSLATIPLRRWLERRSLSA
jgi:uncharacterized membrane protein YdjX (TVP38/TMEM64 family)